ncbi:MAG: hypothetical protein WA040_06685, partial [Anaerolineae bacterium]
MNNNTITVNGVFRLQQGGFAHTGTFSYGSGGTLEFANTSGQFGLNSDHVFWPATNGPHNVTISGSGGLDMNVARTIAGTLLLSGSGNVRDGSDLTVNGTVQFNSSGRFETSGPNYGSSSLLRYYTGGTFTRALEWSAASGAGYPNNVQVGNSTTLNLGSGARSMAGNLTIDSGSTLNQSTVTNGDHLTVGGSVDVQGTLTLSTSASDLFLGGNWTRGGTFTPNGSIVAFNGTAAQTINGSTTFDRLTISNSTTAGVTMNADVAVNIDANISGLLYAGNSTLTIASSGGISGSHDNSKMVVTDVDGTQSGKLCKVWDSGAFTYPIGDARSTAEYSPVAFTPTGPSGLTVCFRVVDAKDTNVPSQVTNDYLTRYWVGNSTAGSFSSYGASFTFVASDIVGDTSQMAPKKWDGGPNWSETGGTMGNPTFSFAGLTSLSQFTAFKSGVLAITLADFYAAQQGDAVLVTWETASELNNRGFNLYRGTSPDGWDHQLNTALIPSQSQGSPSGFVYTWEDRADLVPGVTYYYWLQDVDTSGAMTMHGPVSVDYSGPTAVTLNGIQASPAAGAGALPWLWVVA